LYRLGINPYFSFYVDSNTVDCWFFAYTIFMFTLNSFLGHVAYVLCAYKYSKR